jgi:translocation protein SEC63
MSEPDRRALLRQLSDAEYRDVLNVCAMMPNIEINVRCEVKGEEDKVITAGSLVTATVQLRRHALIDVSGLNDPEALEEGGNDEAAEDKCDDGDEDETGAATNCTEPLLCC